MPFNGVLIVDKPPGLSSHDIVNRVRRILGQKSVGHLGTLDPLATGVLPLVTGSLTRLAQFYLKSEKVYEGVIRFGFATDTYDAEGEPTGPGKPVSLDADQVREVARRFVGVIEQMPPPFSAKKINGVPAYKFARKHKDVELNPVQVEIKNFEISSVDQDRASFRATVSSGTYMRSVAHDLGQQLDCGAHLQSLRRTRLGEFDNSEAHTIDALERAAQANNLDECFIHPRKLLPDMPAVTATDESAARIRSGRAVNLPELSRAPRVKVFYGQRELIAIATRVAGSLFHPAIVFYDSSRT